MSAGLNVECRSEIIGEAGDYLQSHEVKAWLEGVPNGARITQIIKDFGTQRDPQETLVGLRAMWSEVRR
jgi:hypothetical protein